MTKGFLEVLEDTLDVLFENFQFDSWYAVILSVLFWGLFYYLVQETFKDQSPEFYSRVVTLFHGAFMAFAGTSECFATKFPFRHPNEPTTTFQSYIMVVSLGYFIIDLTWCLYYQSESWLMVAHHFYSCFALGRMLFKGYSGNQTSCALGGLEITNPLLQTRWFVRNGGYGNTPLFTAIEITFIIVFFTVRIVIGTYMMVIVLIEGENDMEFLTFAVLIYIMSWMFMINISKFVYYKYLKGNVDEHLPQSGTG